MTVAARWRPQLCTQSALWVQRFQSKLSPCVVYALRIWCYYAVLIQFWKKGMATHSELWRDVAFGTCTELSSPKISLCHREMRLKISAKPHLTCHFFQVRSVTRSRSSEHILSEILCDNMALRLAWVHYVSSQYAVPSWRKTLELHITKAIIFKSEFISVAVEQIIHKECKWGFLAGRDQLLISKRKRQNLTHESEIEYRRHV